VCGDGIHARLPTGRYGAGWPARRLEVAVILALWIFEGLVKDATRPTENPPRSRAAPTLATHQNRSVMPNFHLGISNLGL
jgi:hypothetical protein